MISFCLPSAALRFPTRRVSGGLILGAALLALGSTGCQTKPEAQFPALDAKGRPILDSTNSNSNSTPGIPFALPSSAALKDGDVLRIECPGAPLLNATKTITGGKIDLVYIGEVVAAGKSVPQLEKELSDRYKSQANNSNVNITIVSSAFSVFVSGAVLRPGEISGDKPITAAEAILKAGVDFTKANLKKVKVTRTLNGRYENSTLDLDRVLHGKAGGEPFYLKPGDSIFVPEKFQIF